MLRFGGEKKQGNNILKAIGCEIPCENKKNDYFAASGQSMHGGMVRNENQVVLLLLLCGLLDKLFSLDSINYFSLGVPTDERFRNAQKRTAHRKGLFRRPATRERHIIIISALRRRDRDAAGCAHRSFAISLASATDRRESRYMKNTQRTV